MGMAMCAGAMFQAPRRFGMRTFSSHNWVKILELKHSSMTELMMMMMMMIMMMTMTMMTMTTMTMTMTMTTMTMMMMMMMMMMTMTVVLLVMQSAKNNMPMTLRDLHGIFVFFKYNIYIIIYIIYVYKNMCII